MLGPLIIYPLWICCCLAGVMRPWIGVVAFYGCVLLEPNWNWRWSIPQDFQFQKFLAISTAAGFVLNGFPGNRFGKSERIALSCLIAYLLLAYVSTSQSVAPRLSYAFMSYMWKIVLMALLAARLLDSPKKIVIFLVVTVFAQGYNALQINEYYFSSGISSFAYQQWGFKGDNNLYSNLTVPMLAVAVSSTIYIQNKWIKFACFSVMILQLHQIMLLGSRGAMLAIGATTPYLLYLMPKTKRTIQAIAVTGVLGAVLAGPPVVRQFSSIFNTGKARDSSAESRFELWRVGYAITVDYPLIGAGPYAAQALVPKYYYGGQQKFKIKGLHNLIFQLSAGSGIPSAIFYLVFFLVPWWNCRKIYHKVRLDPEAPSWLKMSTLGITIALPGYLLASMFSSAALLETPYALASAGIAVMCLSKHQSAARQTLPTAQNLQV